MERLFSAGKRVATCKRARLDAKSISTLITLKCWLRQQEADSKAEREKNIIAEEDADEDEDEDEDDNNEDEEDDEDDDTDDDLEGW